MVQVLLFGRIFCGEPVSASPENALVRAACRRDLRPAGAGLLRREAEPQALIPAFLPRRQAIALVRFSETLSRKPVVESHF